MSMFEEGSLEGCDGAYAWDWLGYGEFGGLTKGVCFGLKK